MNDPTFMEVFNVNQAKNMDNNVAMKWNLKY
jgi:hypothetical protein